MWGLAEITWIIAAVLGSWGMAGFVPHLMRPERRAAWWFALAVVLLLLKAGGRSFYWDGLHLFIGEETADAFRARMGGLDFNWVFNTFAILAGLAVLKLLHLLIPEDERHNYTPLSAPLFPAKLTMPFFIAYLREAWSARRDRRDVNAERNRKH